MVDTRKPDWLRLVSPAGAVLRDRIAPGDLVATVLGLLETAQDGEANLGIASSLVEGCIEGVGMPVLAWKLCDPLEGARQLDSEIATALAGG